MYNTDIYNINQNTSVAGYTALLCKYAYVQLQEQQPCEQRLAEQEQIKNQMSNYLNVLINQHT